MKGADLLKFLMSLGVVWIHCGDVSMPFLGWIVPAFFALSGFFLFHKVFSTSAPIAAVEGWWKKTLKLYLIWTLIFLPYAVVGFWRDGLPFLTGAAAWLRNVIFRGENYMSWPLWYLLGMLQAGFIIWLWVKCKAPFWMLCIIALLFWLLPKFVDLNSLTLWNKLMRQTGDGFTVGLPFMVLGGLFRKLFPSISAWPKDSPYYRSSLFLRFMSTHIYLTHMLWLGAVYILTTIPRGFALWTISVAICVASGIVVHKMPKLENMLYGRNYAFL